MRAVPNEVHFIFGLSPDFGGKPFSRPYVGRMNPSQLWSIDSEFCQLARLASCRETLAALPADCREAVVLCDLQAMPIEEAATLLECAASEVTNRLQRGRALLVREREAV